MTKVYNKNGLALFSGDCRDILKKLPENSIDSIVTDPPYEIGFLGKGHDSTGIAYDVDMWRECLRVLKPGGHLLSFGATRTQHRMVSAIEDAGFEIRDQITWLFGQGFPKGQNIGKGIDKKLGLERAIAGPNPHYHNGKDAVTEDMLYGQYAPKPEHLTAPASPEAQQYEGWNTNLKPMHEVICLARKPVGKNTIVENVMEWGTGGINIDGCRTKSDTFVGPTSLSNIENRDESSYLVGKNASHEKFQQAQRESIARANTMGRYPGNVVFSHSPECVEVGTKKVKPTGTYNTFDNGAKPFGDAIGEQYTTAPNPLVDENGQETIPAFECTEDCPVAELDRQSGITKDGVAVQRNGGGQALFGGIADGENNIGARPDAGYSGQGGASRYFPVFKYNPKASTRERPKYYELQCDCEENIKWPESIQTPQMSNGTLSPTEGSVEVGAANEYYNTSYSGNWSMDPSLKDMTSITSTETPSTTISPTSNSLTNSNTNESIADVNSEMTSGGSPVMDLKDAANSTQSQKTTGISPKKDGPPTEGVSPVMSKRLSLTKECESCGTKNKSVSHSTVKPLALIRWMTRLITPPGGICLDPFAGSGTTLEACQLEGFNCIGIELTEEYIPLIIQRIERN